MKTQALTATMILAAALAAPAADAGHGYHPNKWRSASSRHSASSSHYVYRTARNGGDYDYADVVHVQPIVRIVTTSVPHRECWDEEVYREPRRYRGNGTAGATIAGGLIGGVIGRQFGGGSGRDAMTVVGSIVGSAIANDRAQVRRRHDGYADGHFETVRRCETRHEVREEERIEGYQVTYLYNGKEYTTRTESDPGDRIRVRVSVSPLTRS